MTAPVTEIPLEELSPTPIEGVPNHRATSGESGTGGEGSKRPGIFAGKSSGRSPKAAKAKGTVPPLDAKAKESIAKFYQFAGMSLMPFDPVLAGVVVEQAPICADAVFDLAQENEAFRRFIIAMTQTSMYGALIAAHLPILLTVTARHGRTEQARNMGGMGMMMMFNRDVMPVDEESDDAGTN